MPRAISSAALLEVAGLKSKSCTASLTLAGSVMPRAAHWACSVVFWPSASQVGLAIGAGVLLSLLYFIGYIVGFFD